MVLLIKLNGTESSMSRQICQMLFGLHDVEKESWFSPYGGPNQLQSEVSECRGLMQSMLRDINFGCKDTGAQKFTEFMAKGCSIFPASLNFMQYCEENKEGFNGRNQNPAENTIK